MDFTWTPDQKELYQQAGDFARAKMNRNLIEEDQSAIFSLEKWRACGQMGLLGLHIPEEYGGLGLDPITCAYTLEGFGYGCKENGIFLSMGAHLWAVETPILLYGNEDQKQKYLPKLSSGEWVGAHAISEPESGSDAMSMSTNVTIDGDFAILNGRKTFVTNAPSADLFIVFATGSKKHGFAAINCFVIEKGTPGLSVETKTSKMGTRTSHMADVILENCRIPLENRIGKANLGYQIFSRIMMWERALILAPFIGTMQRQMEECIAYANQRQQFGKQLAAYQTISSKIVEMQVRLEAARMLLYKAAWSFEHADPGMPSSIAKLWISESAVQTFLDAIQIFGGYGYTIDYEIERNLRDAIGAKLYSGTTEMQKMLIATHLGLKTK
ncbi:MAG: acyl-CoA dehydrogenase [Chloroflexi bacterium HGW-Chloroflexi-10]|nr:MAG: acyl-CoA dehydrogenase [Chloroflexi bacterium HGW-Chloroflexi-10]